MGLSYLLSCCQDPRKLVSCLDFRYITDVLTEEEAYGESSPGTGSFLVHSYMEATGPSALLSKRVIMLFIFSRNPAERSSWGKKSEVGCEEILFIIFAIIVHFRVSPSLSVQGFASSPCSRPTDRWLSLDAAASWCDLLGQSSLRPLLGARLFLGLRHTPRARPWPAGRPRGYPGTWV